MLCFRTGRVEWKISFWFFALVAVFALLERGALIFYLLLPIAVHEIGHLLVMYAYRVRIQWVAFTALGIQIRRNHDRGLSYLQEMLICFGGPAANLLMALWLHTACFHSMRNMLLVSANLAVAIFNLAPIGNLDGGQLLELLTAHFFSPKTVRSVSKIASFLLLSLLFGFCLFLLFVHRLNLSLLTVCVFLTINVMLRD